MAGTRDGPDGKAVPNITPYPDDGIGGWSASDLSYALETGILPDFDVVGGAMSEVVRDSTGHLTPEDRAAIAEYLLSIEPLPDAASDQEGEGS
jgi:mono/diheme cytochrome c family protein